MYFLNVFICLLGALVVVCTTTVLKNPIKIVTSSAVVWLVLGLSPLAALTAVILVFVCTAAGFVFASLWSHLQDK